MIINCRAHRKVTEAVLTRDTSDWLIHDFYSPEFHISLAINSRTKVFGYSL